MLHPALAILGICFLNLFVAYSIRMGYGIILPEMIRDLGFGRTVGGSIFNAYLLCYICLTPFAGRLTDRIGGRKVIAFCAFLQACAMSIMGFSTGPVFAGSAFALAGFGSAGMWVPCVAVVQRWFSPRRLGAALGVLSSGYGLGFAAMGVLFPLIIRHHDWRLAWWLLGGMALVMTLVNLMFLKSRPEEAGCAPFGQTRKPGAGHPVGGRPKTTAGQSDYRRVMSTPAFWQIGLSYFAICYGLYGFTTFMVDYAVNQLGQPIAIASRLAQIHGFSQLLGVLVVLPLSDKVGRKKTALFSNGVIFCVLVLIFLFGKSFGVLSVLVGVLAIFYAVTFPIYGTLAGEYFSPRLMGTVLGAWTPFYGLGAMAAHWTTGYLRDVSGVYDTAMIINAGAAFLGVVLLGTAKKDAAKSP